MAMARPLPVGFCDVIYRFSMTGDPEEMLVTTSWACDPATFTQSQCDQMAGAIGAILPSLSNACALLGAHIRQGTSSGDPLVYEGAAQSAGTGGATPCPQNTAWLVKKNTGLGGRRNRGRMYLPGVPVAALESTTSGRVTTAKNTAMQTQINTWASSMTGFAWILFPVIIHAGEVLGDIPAPTEITSFSAQQLLATQRRRLRH